MKELEREVFICGAKRTPFGTFGGTLKDVSATELGVAAARAALEQARVPRSAIDHVFFGNVQQTSPDAIYHARHVGLRAGVPEEVPALTVNRLCGSGFQAVVNGSEQIVLGDAEVCLVGGAENMSMAPHVVYGARWGLKFGRTTEFSDSLSAALTDAYCECPMGITAENLAEKYEISRAQCDAYGLRSHASWKAAHDAGRFKDELAPVEVRTRKGTKLFEVDEHPRPDANMEALEKLRPVFKKGGTVTAGNASGINDGAAALVLASAAAVKEHALTPLARVVRWGVAGVDPRIMGIGPAPAIRKALDRAGLDPTEIDLFEVNEAFAAQYLAVEKELGLPRDRTNVNGGAIAIGHPLGASGARITTHLAYEMKRRDAKLGVGAACIGGGQGIAVVLAAP